LHKKKLNKRGYNQVAKFAERLAFHLNTDYVDNILIKTANTKTQTTKGRLGRWQGNRALYTLADSNYFKNKNVLLIDDVITSGATMEMCTKALLETEGITVQITSMAVVAQFQ
jgi:predicted amidophosphoribosyltransferase